MGTLNVYKREGMRSDDLLWTMSGHQGTDWHEALVDIGGACYQVIRLSKTPFQYLFLHMFVLSLTSRVVVARDFVAGRSLSSKMRGRKKSFKENADAKFDDRCVA